MTDFLTNNFKFNFVGPKEQILGAIYCGVLSGVSMTMLFVSGGSTGGFDI
jgi:uncharacterized membrane-anchored protein YitT (DUF2179 family)